MKLLKLLCAALLLVPTCAFATGYLGWSFGMSREQVQAQKEYGPYYPFKNGDLGSQAGPFQGTHVPISFYFNGERLVRVMLIAYMGSDLAAAEAAVRSAVSQLEADFGGVELSGLAIAPATSEAVVAAFSAQAPGLAPGQRFQFGAHPMLENRKAWVSVTAMEQGQYMVAVNYAEP
ncbi:hypothetical protein ACKVMH_00845 [Lysobacter zhanggongensis]|uniref:Uncharacterized protein n=1 Tax=Lysobacter zhanggongensis TaxID=1774951 RepID=A0ABU7YLK4_9GAMM